MAISFSALFEIKTGDTLKQLSDIKDISDKGAVAARNYGTAWESAASKVNKALNTLVIVYEELEALTPKLITATDTLAGVLQKVGTAATGINKELAPLATTFSKLAGNIKYAADQDAKINALFTTLETQSAKAKVGIDTLQTSATKLGAELKLLAQNKLGNLGLGQGAGGGRPSGGRPSAGGPNPDGRNSNGLMGIVGVLMGGALVGQLKGLETGIIDAKMRSDEFKTSLDALGLSAHETGEIYDNFRKYAQAGFSIPGLEKAVTTFERLNLPMKQSLDLAARLAATSGKSIETSTNLLAKIGEGSQMAGRMLQNQFLISPAMVDAEAKKEGGPTVVKDGKFVIESEADRKALLQYVDAINIAQGGAQKLEERNKQLIGSFSSLAEKVEEAKVALGDHMGPAVIALNTGLGKLLDIFQKMPEGQKETIGSLVFLAGSFGSLVALAAPLIYTLTALFRALAPLTAAVEAGTLTWAALAGTAGTAVLAFAGITTAVVLAGGAVIDLWSEMKRGKDPVANMKTDLEGLFPTLEKYNKLRHGTTNEDSKGEIGSSAAAIAQADASRAQLEAHHGNDASLFDSFFGGGEYHRGASAELGKQYQTEIPAILAALSSEEAKANTPEKKRQAFMQRKNALPTLQAAIPDMRAYDEGHNDPTATRNRIQAQAEIKKITEETFTLEKEISREKQTQTDHEKRLADTTAIVKKELEEAKKGHTSGTMALERQAAILGMVLFQTKGIHDLDAERLEAQKLYVGVLQEEYKIKLKTINDSLKLKEVLHIATPQDKVDADKEKVAATKNLARREKLVTGRVSDETKDKIHEAEIEARGAAEIKWEVDKENKTRLLQAEGQTYQARLSEDWKFQQQLIQNGVSKVERLESDEKGFLHRVSDYTKMEAQHRIAMYVEEAEKRLAIQKDLEVRLQQIEKTKSETELSKLEYARKSGLGMNVDPKSGKTIDQETMDAKTKDTNTQINDLRRKRDYDIQEARDKAAAAGPKSKEKQNLPALIERLEQQTEASVAKLREALRQGLENQKQQDEKRAREAGVGKLGARDKSLSLGFDILKERMVDPDKQGHPDDTPENLAKQMQDNLKEQYNTELAILKAKKEIALEDDNKNEAEKANIELDYTNDVLALRKKITDESKEVTKELLKQKALADKKVDATPEMGGIYKSYDAIMKATSDAEITGPGRLSGDTSYGAWKKREAKDDKSGTIKDGDLNPQTAEQTAEDANDRKEKADEEQKKKKAERDAWLERYNNQWSPDGHLGSKIGSRVGQYPHNTHKSEHKNEKKEDKNALHAAMTVTLVLPDGSQQKSVQTVPLKPLKDSIIGQNPDQAPTMRA